MIKTKSISGGVIWSLAGQGLPICVALICIPILIKHLGVERFGLLAFIWMIVGYSSLLDLGIGRALTQGVAERLGRGDHESISAFIQTGIILLLIFGIIVGFGLSISSGWIVKWGLKLPIHLGQEARDAITILSLAVPIIVLGTAFRGILEAHQCFGSINIIKGLTGALLYLSSLGVLFWTREVWVIVVALVLVRLIETLAYMTMCLRLEPTMFSVVSLHTKYVKSIFGFGLWSTLNNLVGTLMTLAYIDRIFISAILGTGALAFYSTPFDMVLRILIIPTALMTVIFPVFSSFGTKSSDQAQKLAEKATNIILYITAPVFMILVILAKPILLLWLGPEFAMRSALNLQLFSIGTFAISLGYVPFALIQAMGRPDLTAKRHLLEIPFYLGISYAAIRSFGLNGSACVWLVWSFVDLWLTYQILDSICPQHGQGSRAVKLWPVGLSFVVSVGLGEITYPLVQFLGAAGLITTFLSWGWNYLLTKEDKESIIRPMSKILGLIAST